jgi:hypothetical protein|nr:MAG TPA: Protein of unknown function (DUF357) [Caudoviricetes sp.]
MGEPTRKQLITVGQFRELARPTSAHLDEDEANAYIRECEDTNIIPAIGWERFKAATGQGEWGDSVLPDFQPSVFLDGGEYTTKKGDCSQGKTKVQKYTSGIRKALAYFTYARFFRADGTIISRAGVMRHRDDYSDHVQDVSSNKQYNDILDMAERYLSDALEYLKAFTPKGEVKPQRGTRAHIHAIGD